jgi:hypothetical protein
MSTNTCNRPWYCSDGQIDEYKAVDEAGGDLKYMKTTAWVRSMIVSLGTISIALYALSIGGNPTIIGGIALVSLAAYNGVEIADYQALTQAIAEQTSERSDETGSEE